MGTDGERGGEGGVDEDEHGMVDSCEDDEETSDRDEEWTN